MLVLEDPGGEPLERLVGGPMELRQFLRLAIGLSAALGRVHQRGLIHKDIKPANALVNASTGQVWLTGFGIASRLARERQSPEPPEIIAGTLAYMAPEQTGRMNRSIDSRSDLYSLGITLYEMLTGSLPFTRLRSHGVGSLPHRQTTGAPRRAIEGHPRPCLCNHPEAPRQDRRRALSDCGGCGSRPQAVSRRMGSPEAHRRVHARGARHVR